MQIPSFISFCWWKLLYSPIKSLENHAMTSVKWLYIIYIYSGESDLVGLGIVIRIKTFPVQTPSEAWLGLGTQHHYKAPNDLRAKNVKRQWLTCGELAVLQNNGCSSAIADRLRTSVDKKTWKLTNHFSHTQKKRILKLSNLKDLFF